MSNVQDNTPPESPKPLSVTEAGDAILSRWEDTPEEELSEQVEQEATPEDNQEETEIALGDDSEDNLDEEIVEDDDAPIVESTGSMDSYLKAIKKTAK